MNNTQLSVRFKDGSLEAKLINNLTTYEYMLEKSNYYDNVSIEDMIVLEERIINE